MSAMETSRERDPQYSIQVSVISATGAEEVLVSIEGHLDFRAAMPLWEISQPELQAHARYVVDLTGVDRVFDSGLASLLMFVRRVNAQGAFVRLVADADLLTRCEKLVAGRCPVPDDTTPARARSDGRRRTTPRPAHG